MAGDFFVSVGLHEERVAAFGQILRGEAAVGAGGERRELGVIFPGDDRVGDAFGFVLLVNEALDAAALRRAIDHLLDGAQLDDRRAVLRVDVPAGAEEQRPRCGGRELFDERFGAGDPDVEGGEEVEAALPR